MDKRERTDRAWLRAAMVFGLTMSHDPERRVGACIVGVNGKLVSFGYNGLPRGLPNEPAVWANKAMKNELVVHAEENAIINAGFDLNYATCYVALKPCHRCLGRLVNAGVRRVVHLDDPIRWKYVNEEAMALVQATCRIGWRVYTYGVVETALLELCGAVPISGFQQYGYEPDGPDPDLVKWRESRHAVRLEGEWLTEEGP